MKSARKMHCESGNCTKKYLKKSRSGLRLLLDKKTKSGNAMSETAIETMYNRHHEILPNEEVDYFLIDKNDGEDITDTALLYEQQICDTYDEIIGTADEEQSVTDNKQLSFDRHNAITTTGAIDYANVMKTERATFGKFVAISYSYHQSICD
jgi:hypothetical protein